MRRLFRVAFWFLLINTAGWLGGRYLAQRMAFGDESSDEFTVATFYSGDTFASTAPALRTGRVVVAMGGLMLDLREATLAATGAHLTLEVTMGGAMIRVADEWLVSVDEELKPAEVHVDVAPSEALPDDAPQLHIRVIARCGGVTITSAPDRRHD